MHDVIADTRLHRPYVLGGAHGPQEGQRLMERRASVTETLAGHERPRTAVRSGIPKMGIPEARIALSAWLKTEVGVFHVKHSNF